MVEIILFFPVNFQAKSANVNFLVSHRYRDELLVTITPFDIGCPIDTITPYDTTHCNSSEEKFQGYFHN